MGDEYFLRDWYEEVIGMLEVNTNRKEKIFGPSVLKEAPFRYWELSVLQTLNIDRREWTSGGYSEKQKGELIAHHMLKSMMEVVSRNAMETQREMDEMKRKAEQAAKKNRGK